jgi:hypothetical protein
LTLDKPAISNSFITTKYLNGIKNKPTA